MKDKFTRTSIRAVMTATGMETNQARALTALIIDALSAALSEGKVVELRGLGTLEPRVRRARTMRNPRTMAPVNVPARQVVFFRPSGKLITAVNREENHGIDN